MRRIARAFCNAANRIVRRSHWYRNIYFCGADKFWRFNTFNLDVANTGSNSGKYAFNYDGLPVKGFNMALGPQSLEHDFNILKNYFSYLHEGARIIITLCPFSCLHSKYGAEARRKYYTFLHPATIDGFDDAERMEVLRFMENPFKAKPKMCIKFVVREMIGKLLYRRVSEVDFSQSAQAFIDGWKKQFGIVDLDAPLSSQHVEQMEQRAGVLRDMIDFCTARSFKPILVIPPVHPALSVFLTEKFRDRYIYDFLRKVNRPDVQFMDDMVLPGFEQDEYFINALFISELGAKRYTRIVLDRVGLLGGIDSEIR